MIDRDREPEPKRAYNCGSDHKLAVLTEDDVLVIRKWYASGEWTHGGLAKEFGVSKATIGQITRGDTWKHVGGTVIKGHRPTNWGEKHQFAKLKEADVLQIFSASVAGHDPAVLADFWGVSISTIRNILAGRAWKHLL